MNNKALAIVIAILIFLFPYFLSQSVPFTMTYSFMGNLAVADFIMKIATFTFSCLFIFKVFGKKQEKPKKKDDVE